MAILSTGPIENYVANFFSDSVSVINGITDTVVATIPVGSTTKMGCN